jgi:uncharacterized protein
VPEKLTLTQARRIALAAQGFTDRRPGAEVGRRHLRRVLGRTGLFQMDSVNVLIRAHYLPAYSRLGAYPTATLDRMAYRRPRELFEYWGHEASLLPVELQPLLRWRMAEAEHQAWGRMRRIQRERPGFVEKVYAQVAERGPIGAGKLDEERPARTGPWWDWHDAKIALEWLFWCGRVTTATRRGFERLYDLPERVLPAQILATPTPSRADAQRELLRRAAAALGVATARDLRDYHRLSPDDAIPRIAELVESGDLLPVTVQGWRQQAYLHRDARIPRKVNARALIVPFDPLVWERDRTERLFGMRYRIEIYVPADRRVHGYYVLPFLLGDNLVARVDLKSDRQAGVLRVQSAHLEDGRPAPEVAEHLATELTAMATWLGLSGVHLAGPGDLTPHLQTALATT